MFHKIKNIFNQNTSLVKSYKVNIGEYFITEEDLCIIDTKRFFKSLRETSKLKFKYPIKIQIKNIEISPIHLNLLARGLSNQSEHYVRISTTLCSSKTLIQLKNLLIKLGKVKFFILFTVKGKQILDYLHVLEYLKVWKGDQLNFTLNELSYNLYDERMTIEKRMLALYSKYSGKFKVLLLSSWRLSRQMVLYKHFKNTCGLNSILRGSNDEFNGCGNISLIHL